MASPLTNPLSTHDILAHLRTRLWGRNRLEIHDRIDSTNRRAMDLGRNGAPEGTVVLAENQTSGRGRHGRAWHSPPRTNLYMSIVLRPDIESSVTNMITLAAGLGAARGLTEAAGMPVGVKWPNDLMLHQRKLAGILAELEPSGPQAPFVVLGIGVNVNMDQDQWPQELASKAISLKMAMGRSVDRALVLAVLLNEMEREYMGLQQGRVPDLLDRYRRACITLKNVVTVASAGGSVTGLALDVDDQGRLMVEQPDRGILHLDAGEVTLSVPPDKKAL